MNPTESDILSLFHPLLKAWFKAQYGSPTAVQADAWPRISRGDHVLITAPTGSGKTLTAFLWALHQLITGLCEPGYTRILYVSPLKALNNDIQKNLLDPLSQLRQVFDTRDQPFPDIRVLTRSGDTPQSDRRKMLRHPPEILITTPESLNLLLSSKGGRTMLMGLSTVILDEIHAVFGNKRGTYLMTAVDRLVQLSGEFQRIALSATIRPMGTVSAFIGGFILKGSIHDPAYEPRPVHRIQPDASKRYDISVRFPETAANRPPDTKVWKPLVASFKEIIHKNRSTLLFVNSRRLCEKLTYLINLDESQPIAYAHHGSLSRELRGAVEKKLKAGELRAIVATHSLELGIDIGTLDEVVLVQSAGSVSSGIQRIGRAGHRVGEVSRGILFPTHSQDFLEAAVLASGIIDRAIEPIQPVDMPLDVLAQIIVSMVGVETWNIHGLFAFIRTSYPYRNLTRQQFDLVLNMLAGRYTDSRIRELKPRISIDGLDGTVAARKGALLVLYLSGGVIPDRGYFNLRHQDTASKLGDLDEEFVWEARIGQTFTLGTQNWRIKKITHNDVFVTPTSPDTTAPPFWKAEENSRDFHFSERIGEFLEHAENRLDDSGYMEHLKNAHFMEDIAAVQLVEFLKKQRDTTGCRLPHRHHVLLEHIRTGPGGTPGNQVVIHTVWGGRVNRPYALALEAAWKNRFHQRIETFTSNDCVVLCLPHILDSADLLGLVTSRNFESLLRQRLEGSGFFGARFRECAGRALLLNRKKINERMPLWLSRLRSQKLLDAVSQYDDFPILLETWRSCLKDEFDLDSLSLVLTELELGTMQWSHAQTGFPSPMARAVSWRQINQYMYMDDSPEADTTSRLRNDLLREVVFSPGLRPPVPVDIVHDFQIKRHRLFEGYSPETPRELVDWVKERLLIPRTEWDALLESIQRDHRISMDDLIHGIGEKVASIFPEPAKGPLICFVEMLPRVMSHLYPARNLPAIEFVAPRRSESTLHVPVNAMPLDERMEGASTLVGEWLRFYGPVTRTRLEETLGLDRELLAGVMDDLMESGLIICGSLTENSSEEELCDSENFEILLRMLKARSVPVFEPMPIERLSIFLARFQRIVHPQTAMEGLYGVLEQLLCFSAPAGMWETEIFPARLNRYDPSWMDAVMQEGAAIWVGTGEKQILFCFQQDLDLLGEKYGGGKPMDTLDSLFLEKTGRYPVSSLMEASDLSLNSLYDLLWAGVWQGRLSNDSFLVLRRGVENKFRIPAASRAPSRRRRGRRSAVPRRPGTIPVPGNWFKLPAPDSTNDLIEEEERQKDRVRLLLDRYGILFRALLIREQPGYRWQDLFRSMRLMELSGEILAGYFFDSVSGPQFISREAFHLLQQGLSEEAIYWINAADPASLCGIPIDSLKGSLPKRLMGTHLVYKGSRLVLVSKRLGKALTIHAAPDDPELPEYFEVLRHLLTRKTQPRRHITIETINEDPAIGSPFIAPLRIQFDLLVDAKTVTLYRKENEGQKGRG